MNWIKEAEEKKRQIDMFLKVLLVRRYLNSNVKKVKGQAPFHTCVGEERQAEGGAGAQVGEGLGSGGARRPECLV